MTSGSGHQHGVSLVERVPAARAPAAQSETLFEIDIKGMVRALKRGRYILLAIVALGLALGALATLLTPPTFVAESTIRIEQDLPQVTPTDSSAQQPAAGDYTRFAQTQIDLIRSREMAAAVVDQARLLADARFVETAGLDGGGAGGQARRREAAAAFVRNALRVTLPEDTRVAAIAISSRSPEVATRIANAYAEAAVAQDLRRKFDSSGYARDYLTRQLGLARERLESSEVQLNNYARQTGIVNVGPTGTQTVTNANLAELSAAGNRATERRMAAEQAWRTVSRGSPMSVPQVVANPAVQALVQQRAQVRARLDQDRQTMGAEHPTVVAGRANLEAIEQEIRRTAAAITDSLRREYETARSQELSAQQRVNQLQDAALTENEAQVQYNILKRQVDTNRALYDGLLQRLSAVNAQAGVNNSNIAIVDRAVVPTSPASPNLILNLAVAGVGSLFLGLLLVLVREQMDQRLRTPAAVAAEADLPIIGIIPMLKDAGTVLEELARSRSPISEAYFSVRTSLSLATPEGLPHVTLVTSNGPGEGKTTSAYALALSVARLGRRTLLVDADLRRPQIHVLLNRPNRSGLSDFLAGAGRAPTQQPTDIPNLFVVTSGPIPPSPTELLAADTLPRFLDWARSQYDAVILDGPPVLGIADVPLIAAAVDGTVFVVEMSRATRFSLRNALDRLRVLNASPLGLLLTKHVAAPGDDDYQNYYEYESTREVA